MIPVEFIIAFAGGLLLSGLYFAALWLTVRRLPRANSPYALLMVSFLLRTAGLLSGFYLVTQGHWERLVACLIGFVVVRTLCVAQMKSSLLRNSPA